MAISLLFTGHMIDLPDRPEPRFPASLEQAARVQIGEAISAAYRTLRHDRRSWDLRAAREAGTSYSTRSAEAGASGPSLCSPSSRTSSSGAQLKALWEATGQGGSGISGTQPQLTASTCSDWRQGMRPMPKCNTELLEMARQHGPVHLIALWDGKGGDGPGGTADLVLRLGEEDKPDIFAPSDLHS